MTSERDFYAAMDADPDDIDIRGIFADWLEERNDPLAAGWRALWVGGYKAWWFSGSECWGFWGRGSLDPLQITLSVPAECHIPGDWLWNVERTRHVQFSPGRHVLHTPGKKYRKTYGPRVLLKALAVAFTKLPAERQAELLRPVSSTVNA